MMLPISIGHSKQNQEMTTANKTNPLMKMPQPLTFSVYAISSAARIASLQEINTDTKKLISINTIKAMNWK